MEEEKVLVCASKDDRAESANFEAALITRPLQVLDDGLSTTAIGVSSLMDDGGGSTSV